MVFLPLVPLTKQIMAEPKAEAAFTVKDISSDDMRNTYVLESTTDNAFLYQWDLGNGTDPFVGSKVDTVVFENKGSFTVTLTAVSEGGSSTTTQTVEVEEDAVTGTSAVTGGDMSDKVPGILPALAVRRQIILSLMVL